MYVYMWPHMYVCMMYVYIYMYVYYEAFIYYVFWTLALLFTKHWWLCRHHNLLQKRCSHCVGFCFYFLKFTGTFQLLWNRFCWWFNLFHSCLLKGCWVFNGFDEGKCTKGPKWIRKCWWCKGRGRGGRRRRRHSYMYDTRVDIHGRGGAQWEK